METSQMQTMRDPPAKIKGLRPSFVHYGNPADDPIRVAMEKVVREWPERKPYFTPETAEPADMPEE